MSVDLLASSLSAGLYDPLSEGLRMHATFSPTNWRLISFAGYPSASDITVWSLEFFASNSTSSSSIVGSRANLHARIRLPLTEYALANPEPVCLGPKLNRDEFAELCEKTFTGHITGLNNETYSFATQVLADKRERHKLRALCWTASRTELLIATEANYVFKCSVNEGNAMELKDNGSGGMELVIAPSDVPQASLGGFHLTGANYIERMKLHKHGVFVASTVSLFIYGSSYL